MHAQSVFKIRHLIILFVLFISSELYAQNTVSIGTDELKSSAVLYLKGNGSQAFIIPIVDAVNQVSNPEAGMVVYQSSDNKVYFHNGSQWSSIGSGTGGGSSYSLQYNAGTNQLTLLEDGSGTPITLSSDALSLNGVDLPAGNPAGDQILVFNGSAWEYQALPTGTFSGVTVDGTTIQGDGLSTPLSVVSVDDADADASNELQDLSLTGTTLNISSGTGVDLAPIIPAGSTDDQNLVLTGNVLSIEGGTGSIDLSTYVDDADADPTNEIQNAAGVAVTPAGNLTATNTQAALVELQTDIDGIPALPATTDAQIIVSNGTTPQAVTMSGDVFINNTGVTSITTNAVGSTEIANNTVLNEDISVAAAIDVTKIASPGGSNKGILTTTGIANTWLTTASPNRVFGTDLSNALTGRTVVLSTGAAVDNIGVRDAVNASDANLVSEAAVREAIDASGGGSLQSAYDGGNSIVLTDGTTPVNIRATSGTGDFESLMSFSVSDATGSLNIGNGTGTNANFTPVFNATTTGTNPWSFRRNALNAPPFYFEFAGSENGGLAADFSAILTISNDGATRFNFSGAGNMSVYPTLSSAITIRPFNTAAGNTSNLEFAELAANGNNFVGFKAPDAIASDVIWTLPDADGTNGQILSTDGLGNLAWSSGSGATLQSAYNGGETFNMDGADLVINNTDGSAPYFSILQTDGKIGIGTASPGYEVDVRGPSTNFGGTLRLANSDVTHEMQIFPGHSADPNPFILVKAGDPLRFATDASGFTETMRIDVNGNVGIGATSPNAKLEVISTASAIAGSTNSNASNEYAISGINSGTGDVAGFFQVTNPASTFAAVYGQSEGSGPGVFGASNGTGPGASFFNFNAGNATPVVQIINSGTGPALEASAPIKITDGTQGVGKVLTSDVNGLASWQTPTGSPDVFISAANQTVSIGNGAGTAGNFNTIMGHLAGTSNTGAESVLIGRGSGGVNQGSNNTLIGVNAASSNSTGGLNTVIGSNAGAGTNSGVALTTGGSNTLLGANSDVGTNSLTNATAIGYNAVVNASNAMVLGGTGANAVNVGIGTSAPRSKFQVENTFGVFYDENQGQDIIAHNVYENGVGDFRYSTTAGASIITMMPERVGFFTFPSGTADASISGFSTRMNLTSGGLVINGDNLNASSILDINSTTKGILVPRLTTVQRDAIASPATGLMVYNSTTNGFNFFNGAIWTSFGGGSSLWTDNSPDISYTAGNVGIGGLATAISPLSVTIPNTNTMTKAGLNVYNQSSGASNQYGVISAISVDGLGEKTGFYTTLESGTSAAIGMFSSITTNGSAPAIGFRSQFLGSSTGDQIGVLMEGEDYNLFSGNVGIGTTYPNGDENAFILPGTNLVHLADINTPFYILERTNAVNPSKFGMAISGTGSFAIQDVISNRNIFGIDSGSDIDLMRLSGSNVGIGTITPTDKLHINSGSAVTVSSRFTNSATGATGSDGFSLGINGSGQAFINNDEATPINISTNATTRLTIAGNGRVGIGTTTPSTTFDVNGQIALNPDNGWGTGGIRFKDTGGTLDGAIVQTVTGALFYRAPGGADGSNGHVFTAGSGSPFLMSILNNGLVGIGTATPSHPLHVQSSQTDFVARMQNTNTDTEADILRLDFGSVSPAFGGNAIGIYGGGGYMGGIRGDGAGGIALANLSDRRAKENIKDTELDGVDIIRDIRIRDFNYKGNLENKTGFIAQELYNVYRPAVGGAPDGDFETAPMTVSSMELIPVTIKAIQEQQALIEKQQAMIDALLLADTENKKKIEVLEASVSTLKSTDETKALQAQLDLMKFQIDKLTQILTAEASKGNE